MIVKIIEKVKVVETIEFDDYTFDIIINTSDEIEINNKLFIVKKRRFIYKNSSNAELHLFV
jgi:hypothetical protein